MFMKRLCWKSFEKIFNFIKASTHLYELFYLLKKYIVKAKKQMANDTARLFHYVLFNMGDLHLVLPALNLSKLNAGILIMMQQVILMMFSLNMVGGLWDFSVSPRPLGFGFLSFWVFGFLGFWVWGLGLTIKD